MSALFKKQSALAKRRKRIEKELSSVSSDIRSLSKSVGGRSVQGKSDPVLSGRTSAMPAGLRREDAGLAGQSPARAVRDEAPDIRKKSKERPPTQLHDERFVGYLANSFDSMRPLRHERRIQRNKAIVMAVVVLLLLFWLLYRYWFMQ